MRERLEGLLKFKVSLVYKELPGQLGLDSRKLSKKAQTKEQET